MLTYLGFYLLKLYAENVSWRTRYVIAAVLSDLEYFFMWRKRAKVRANVATVLAASGRAGREVQTVTRQIFRSFGRYLADFLSLSRYTDEEIRRWVRVEGLPVLDEIWKAGRGGVLLTAHFGNWELAGMIVSLHGYPVTSVAQAHGNKRLNDLFMRIRSVRGVRCVTLGAGVRECFRALKRREFIGIVWDWVDPGKGVPVNLFGKATHFPVGPAVLAVTANVPILPGVLTYDEKNQPCLKVSEVVWPPQTGSKDEKVARMSEKLASTLEAWISQNLTQWCMFHRIWAD